MISFNIVFAQNEFTQKDRELLEDLRVTIGDLRVTIGELRVTIEQMDKRVDFLQTFMLWGFGILFGGIALMIGMFRSERSISTKKKPYSPSKREKLLETIFKDFAKDQPKLAEILKTHGL